MQLFSLKYAQFNEWNGILITGLVINLEIPIVLGHTSSQIIFYYFDISDRIQGNRVKGVLRYSVARKKLIQLIHHELSTKAITVFTRRYPKCTILKNDNYIVLSSLTKIGYK